MSELPINLPTFLSLVVIAALLFGGTLFVIRLIEKNDQEGSQFREKLRTQINSLRLSKMLKHRGIEFHRYLFGERTVDIETNIENCRQCTELKVCDQVLDGTLNSKDFSFCPNCHYLTSITEQPEEPRREVEPNQQRQTRTNS